MDTDGQFAMVWFLIGVALIAIAYGLETAKALAPEHWLLRSIYLWALRLGIAVLLFAGLLMLSMAVGRPMRCRCRF